MTKIQEAKELQRKHQVAKVKTLYDLLDIISHRNLQSLTIGSCFNKNTKLSLLIDTLNNNLPSLKIFE